MSRWLIVVVLIGIVGCNPAPRDVRWFEVNPHEAEKVIASCAAGPRSSECENARTGLSRVKANARMERYRRGFE